MLDDLVCMICISWAMGWEETYVLVSRSGMTKQWSKNQEGG